MEDRDAVADGPSAADAQQPPDKHEVETPDAKRADKGGKRPLPRHQRRLPDGRDRRWHGQQSLVRQSSFTALPPGPQRQTLLGPGGRFDCFDTLPSGADGADFVTKLVLYAHQQVYSNFFVGEAKDTSVLPYTKYALRYEHAYWGAAWFTCTSRRWLEGRSLQHSPQEMFFYSKSLESLRRALSDPLLATHESTISTILHLSFPPYLPEIDKSVPRPRQSNFKTWNLLHLATGLNVAEEHMLGLSAVVNTLGGVHNIQSAQIRRSVCFQGIHFSGRHLKAPLFPFASLHPVEELVSEDRLVRPRQLFESTASPTSANRGTGFLEISFPFLPETASQPKTVFAYLADMTTILEDYASGGSAQSQASLILDQMQFVQHCLLSLPPAADLQSQKHEEGIPNQWNSQLQIYEIARWACICYANLVTYPTDYSTFPRLRLVRLLLHELELLRNTEKMTMLRLQEMRLLFWATVLAAILAVGLEEERKALVALVARFAAQARVTSWMEAKQIMDSFLWHSQTNDPDALKLWIEVQKLERQSIPESRLPERRAASNS